MGLLRKRGLITREDDLLWRFNPCSDGNGYRKYTQDINTGDWWKRSELKFCYRDDGTLIEWLHLLGLMVFIDDTQVVNKGNRTSKPVVLALANMRGQIRQKEVRACVV